MSHSLSGSGLPESRSPSPQVRRAAAQPRPPSRSCTRRAASPSPCATAPPRRRRRGAPPQSRRPPPPHWAQATATGCVRTARARGGGGGGCMWGGGTHFGSFPPPLAPRLRGATRVRGSLPSLRPQAIYLSRARLVRRARGRAPGMGAARRRWGRGGRRAHRVGERVDHVHVPRALHVRAVHEVARVAAGGDANLCAAIVMS